LTVPVCTLMFKQMDGSLQDSLIIVMCYIQLYPCVNLEMLLVALRTCEFLFSKM